MSNKIWLDIQKKKGYTFTLTSLKYEILFSETFPHIIMKKNKNQPFSIWKFFKRKLHYLFIYWFCCLPRKSFYLFKIIHKIRRSFYFSFCYIQEKMFKNLSLLLDLCLYYKTISPQIIILRPKHNQILHWKIIWKFMWKSLAQPLIYPKL